MTTIALYNLKGGVGKTASCVNFAYLAAADGFKTLLWDIDPQGSSSFYYKAKPKVHPGIKKLITKDADLFSQCFYSHNFGHNGPLDFHGLGINGKISELQAAMGLCLLPYMAEIYNSRRAVVTYYNNSLDWSKLTKMMLNHLLTSIQTMG